jgi:hypothetical protein
VYPHHFLLWTNTPAIEVGRTDDKLDLYCLPKLFQGFPTHGRRETLALFDASRHALPLPRGKVLLFRALEEKVPAVRLAPYECTNHCTKTTHSHGETSPVAKKLPNAAPLLLPEAGARHERTLAAVSCTP